MPTSLAGAGVRDGVRTFASAVQVVRGGKGRGGGATTAAAQQPRTSAAPGPPCYVWRGSRAAACRPWLVTILRIHQPPPRTVNAAVKSDS
jgi:hypothetical protein